MSTPTATPRALSSWDALIDRALAQGASDVHVHVHADRRAVLRARMDGVLVPWGELDAAVATPAITRLRADANMATGSSLLVGEGRVRHHSPRGPVDLRVTVAPLVGGALKIALRLPAVATDQSLAELGFDPHNLARVEQLLGEPDGLVLTTGPTGSGKTTTQIAALRFLAAPGRSVITVEDPVEQIIADADQLEVNDLAGFTYEHILRSLLRLDLDTLLIGEIRDRATAQHAVQIAKAGRLVLSTLHSGSSAGALLRLVELSGLGPLEVIESVRGVISQRLVRRVHAPCSGAGCPECLFTGYRGRVPLHEVLVVSEPLREALVARSTAAQLSHMAQQAGLRTFRQDASRWLDTGATTTTEIERVLGRD